MEQDITATMPAMDSGKQKEEKGWKIATAIASLVAVCGIGFGVYGMVQNSQLPDLKVQIKEEDGTVKAVEASEIEASTDGGAVVTISGSTVGYHNQILASSDPNEVYTTYYYAPTRYPEGWVLTMALTDGAITYCRIGIRTAPDVIAYGEVAGARECEISGISKKIHRIVEFGSGHDYSYFNVGFIMEDGTVQYLPIQNALVNDNFNAEKVLKIDGYVIGTIDPNVTVLPQGGGYRRTMFILSDGSFIGFDESML